MVAAMDLLCDQIEAFARGAGRHRGADGPFHLHHLRPAAAAARRLAAVNQRLIATGLRLRVSLIAESGQLPSSHHIACALGFGAAAVYCLTARLRAEEKYPSPPAPAGRRPTPTAPSTGSARRR